MSILIHFKTNLFSILLDTTFYEKATESELARCLTELTASSFKQIISDIPQLYS